VGRAASIPHLEQDQRGRQQKYYWNQRTSEEALLFHSVEDRFGKQFGIQRSGETGIDCHFILLKVFRRNFADVRQSVRHENYALLNLHPRTPRSFHNASFASHLIRRTKVKSKKEKL